MLALVAAATAAVAVEEDRSGVLVVPWSIAPTKSAMLGAFL